jgi:2-polyprenyl-6-methoxyphenol hydroxylase-like FAD-dependent oxidoreductase
LDALLAEGTPPIRRTVFHYGDDAVAVSIRAAGGVDALYAPRRTVLDRLLVDAAARAGAHLEFSTRVEALTRDDSGAVTGVVIADRGRSSRRTERARLVVGADGRGSLVAAAVGAPRTASGRYAGEYLYGYWAGLGTEAYEWFYAAGHAAGIIPTNHGEACVFVGGPPTASLGQRRGSARSTFDLLGSKLGLAERLGSALLVGPIRRVHRLPSGYLRQAYGPGWALVGDAGHWLDPISTHGMTAALRDADLLSAAILAGEPPEIGLARYQAVRDRLSLPMLELTDRIAAYRWTPAEVRNLLRAMASAMADEVEAIADLMPTDLASRAVAL